MTVFNPATFRTAKTKPRHIDIMFNGPIKAGTVPELPIAKKFKAVFGDTVYLVGWPGKVGCFSVLHMEANDFYDEKVDVAFYIYNDPKNIGEVDKVNAVYEEYDVRNGWGFAALAKLNQLIAEYEEFKRTQ